MKDWRTKHADESKHFDALRMKNGLRKKQLNATIKALLYHFKTQHQH